LNVLSLTPDFSQVRAGAWLTSRFSGFPLERRSDIKLLKQFLVFAHLKRLA
jgi:hypothetical protein